MLALAAIDLLEGRCVRLLRGDFAAATVYAEDPLATARALAAGGAPGLHVVDLSGARDGRARHAGLIAEIVRTAGVPVQVGGGVRSAGEVETLLAAGAARVVLGTAALRDPRWTAEVVARFGPERIVVAVDVRGETAYASGWTASVDVPVAELLQRLQRAGVRTLLVTDIGRDGTLEGPNLDLYRRLAGEPFGVVAAGGISRLAELEALAAAGVEAAVVGRALYAGTLTPGELSRFASAPGLALRSPSRLAHPHGAAAPGGAEGAARPGGPEAGG